MDADYDLLHEHKFFHNRIVTYLGRDYEFTHGESHIFLSDIPLYENLHTSDDHGAFGSFTCVCISSIRNNNWVFHILRERFQMVSEL